MLRHVMWRISSDVSEEPLAVESDSYPFLHSHGPCTLFIFSPPSSFTLDVEVVGYSQTVPARLHPYTNASYSWVPFSHL